MITPILVPCRPGVATVSYGGPRADQIAQRLPRLRAAHAEAVADARAARSGAEHARAGNRAALARLQLRSLLACHRALRIVWFDRGWFYLDDPEYARRCALMKAGRA